MPASETTPAPPRVLMMVGNDISHDTRVLKSALALADGGVDVTLLGYSSSGRREESTLGPVRIIRVPVQWRLRDAAQRRKSKRPMISVAPDPMLRRTADTRAALRAREALVQPGVAARSRAVWSHWVTESNRIRAGADRRLKKVQTRAWRAVDAALARRGSASWRRMLPDIDDYELAFGPVIDHLEWDILHAHDVHLVGVAARAVTRRRERDPAARWVYDAHEFVAGLSQYGSRTKAKIAAYVDLEAEYITSAAEVITVTEPLADELQRRYHLPRTPDVVMNSPVLGAATRPVERGVREVCGLADDTELLVYSGGITAARGIGTALEALTLLPETHLALVCVPHTQTHAVREFQTMAGDLGVASRVHFLDPVRPDEVTAFVRSADIGLLPLRHFGSHEVALANKLFEYLYAGLPVLVSDCKAQADFVREHEVGAVHTADDPADLAAQARWLLDHRDEVRTRIESHPDLLTPYAWEHQERTLRGVYRRLFPEAHITEPHQSSSLDGLTEVTRTRAGLPPVIGIGPANMAGQAWAWAKALEAAVPQARTEVTTVDRGSPLIFPTDVLVSAEQYAKDPYWASDFEADALNRWTHALLEAGRPLFGLRNGRDFSGDAEVLRAVGIDVAVLLHGSEIRDPALNARRTPWSPYTDPQEELTAKLQENRDILIGLLDEFDGPVFVSTPDLLLDYPRARLLPVVVDVDRWASDRVVMERAVPRVIHAASRAAIKGTAVLETALAPLIEEGRIDYRRLEGVPPEQMPAELGATDIYLDQFALGGYGVAACEAMAAGAVVVGHVVSDVRDLCPGLPIVEADPTTVAQVITDLCNDRDRARDLSAAGVEYVRANHDGRRSAQILIEVLGLPAPSAPNP